MDLVLVAAVTLHTLATVVVLGYFAVLGRVALPAMRRALSGPQVVAALAGMQRRARTPLTLSLVVFFVSGLHLMTVDPQYGGLGRLDGGAWAPLILLKHLVVGFLVVAAIGADRLIEGLAGQGDELEPAEGSLRLIGLVVDGVSVLGVAILVLTAAAQAATG